MLTLIGAAILSVPPVLPVQKFAPFGPSEVSGDAKVARPAALFASVVPAVKPIDPPVIVPLLVSVSAAIVFEPVSVSVLELFMTRFPVPIIGAESVVGPTLLTVRVPLLASPVEAAIEPSCPATPVPN